MSAACRPCAVRGPLAAKALLVVGLLAPIAPACTDDGRSATEENATRSRRSAPTSTSQAENSGEQAVLEAYQGYWRAVLAANNPPDELHPLLRQYATGDAFESVFKAAQANRLEGKALRRPDNSRTEHRAQVVSMSDEEATVRDCAIDDLLVVKIDTGEVLNDKVATQLRTATLRRENGAWKVAHTKLEERWDGIAGCAVEI